MSQQKKAWEAPTLTDLGSMSDNDHHLEAIRSLSQLLLCQKDCIDYEVLAMRLVARFEALDDSLRNNRALPPKSWLKR